MSPDWWQSQIEDLKLAVLVADAGEFASVDAVAAFLLKHGHQVGFTNTEVKPNGTYFGRLAPARGYVAEEERGG